MWNKKLQTEKKGLGSCRCTFYIYIDYIILSKCKFEGSAIMLRSKKIDLADVAYVIEKSLFL